MGRRTGGGGARFPSGILRRRIESCENKYSTTNQAAAFR
ncbi:hypothetical protein CISIN_1g045383mg [Citrus sinensis]|uniref:Uncharacterized protein n=1 Tax=Citrus sinensis TaxID=2711 RepID=A0A067DGQ7_CITSI|nr:hypothetical protein CISIN_1g045383mg [Citrus sinensis]